MNSLKVGSDTALRTPWIAGKTAMEYNGKTQLKSLGVDTDEEDAEPASLAAAAVSISTPA